MDQTKTKKKLPATIICGFLGSGKTTLLNHLLSLKHNHRVAIIVNDMGEINVDAQLVANGQYSIKKTKEKLVEMQNGCICCTLREDLMKEMSKLCKSGKYDYVLIESSGISEPLPIAQAFTFENEQIKQQKISLKNVARIDTMVTVIDASNFLNQIKSNESFAEINMVKGERMDQVPLSQLLLDQVEFANVLILNKTDLVSKETLAYIKELLSKLNPTAKVVESQYGKINPGDIINTKMFDIDKAQTTTKWIEELQKPFHTSETIEYNIQSCVYKARKPFHPQKILDFLNTFEQQVSFWGNILRAKGFMWIAKKDAFKIEIQKAGEKLNYSPNAFWWISLHKSKWSDSPEEIKEIEKEIESIWLPPPIGDKRQEIVFIGQNLPKDHINKLLDECLLTDQEFEYYLKDGGDNIPDVFPQEWDELEKLFASKGVVREQDGEWEDDWNEEELQNDEENDK